MLNSLDLLPPMNRRNFEQNLYQQSQIRTNEDYININLSCKNRMLHKLPRIKTSISPLNFSGSTDNMAKNKKIDFKRIKSSNKRKILSLNNKKKKDEYLALRKLKILKLDELEAQKKKKINERYEEFKKLNDDEKKILLEFEKEKQNYQDELSKIRRKIKETLENFEKIKLQKETEIENLNIDILKKKTNIISFDGLNTIIENMKKESLTYEEIIKDIAIYGIFIKNELYKFKVSNDKFDYKGSEAIKNNHNLEILLDMLNTKGIHNELIENYKDKNLPSLFIRLLLLDNFIGEKSSFKFNLSKFKCEQIKTVIEEQIKFSEYIKTLINSNFKIPKEKIIINNFRGEKDENEMMCDIYFTSHKFKDEHIQFINNIYKIIDIKENFLKEEFLQFKKFEEEFDELGDNLDGGWGEKKIIGGREYDPPIGYIGIGLNVNKYGNDKTWLGVCNAEGEWPVAYHGVGGHLVYNKARSIIKNNLIAGNGNAFGEGIYFGREIRIADEYAKYSKDINNKYFIVFMCRVNPKKIKIVKKYPEYWLLPGNGKGDFIRPYRLLVKEKTI